MFHLSNSQSLTVSEFEMGNNVGTSLLAGMGGGGNWGICSRPQALGGGGGVPKCYKRKISCTSLV